MAKANKDGTFSCSGCGKTYSSPVHADSCRDSHEILYIPITKMELNRLINAIYSGDSSIIPYQLIEKLKRYARNTIIQDVLIKKENN